MLLDPACLTEALLDWLPALERVLGPVEATAAVDSHVDVPGDEKWDREGLALCSEPEESFLIFNKITENVTEDEKKENSDDFRGKDQKSSVSNWTKPEPVRLEPPRPIQTDLLSDLTQLATLYAELSCFRKLLTEQGLGCMSFLRRYFFLLDQERVRRMCLLCYQEQPEVQSAFMEAMLGEMLLFFRESLHEEETKPTVSRSGLSFSADVTRSSKMVEVIQRGDLLKSLRSLRELQPWSAPPLLAHLHRSVHVLVSSI